MESRKQYLKKKNYSNITLRWAGNQVKQITGEHFILMIYLFIYLTLSDNAR